jgi:hypothetical protein
VSEHLDDRLSACEIEAGAIALRVTSLDRRLALLESRHETPQPTIEEQARWTLQVDRAVKRFNRPDKVVEFVAPAGEQRAA